MIGYDGASYRSQLALHTKKVVPVVTFVLYFGAEEKMFKSDFGIVADFFVQKRKNKNYIPDDKRIIEHVDEVLKLLSVMTGDRKYETVLCDNEKGRVNRMCDVADRLVNSGIVKGREEGILKGESKMASLINKLMSEGRSDDVMLATEDEEARKRFYKEFGIID